MKYLIPLFFLATSISGYAKESTQCRLAVKGYHFFLEGMSDIEVTVESILQKKGIELIQEADLREGDFVEGNALESYEGYSIVFNHEYLMTKSRKPVLIPCVALPLCSPFGVEETVTSIYGLRYKDHFKLSQINASGKVVPVLSKKFTHSYKGPMVFDRKKPEYVNSPEHRDLALAIARKLPSCKELQK